MDQFIAFAFREKSFSIAITVFFIFFLLVQFSGLTVKSFLENVLRLVVKEACSHPTNIFCFPRRLEDVFSVTLFVSSKTSSRRLQDVFVRRLAVMSSRRLQDVFARRLVIMSSRRLQDVFKTSSEHLHQDECLLGKIWLIYWTHQKIFP